VACHSAAGEDQHPGGDEFMPDMAGRAGVPGPGGDAGGFGPQGRPVEVTVAERSQFGGQRLGLGSLAEQ